MFGSVSVGCGREQHVHTDFTYTKSYTDVIKGSYHHGQGRRVRRKVAAEKKPAWEKQEPACIYKPHLDMLKIHPSELFPNIFVW